MRITGGIYRGFRLNSPQGQHIRPTSDRVREALFNILVNSRGFDFENAHVLDLFCGAGTLGLEALSRGAKSAHFIDKHRTSLKLTQDNAAKMGVADQITTLNQDATRLKSGLNIPECGLVFVDPPYRKDLANPALMAAIKGGYIAKDALIVVEMATSHPEDIDETRFVHEDTRTYGDTSIALYTFRGDAA